MMRGRTSAAVSIRRPDNSIYLHEELLNPRIFQNRAFRLPFLRGLVLLWEMLVLGTRLMTLSANIATGAINPDVPTASTHPDQTTLDASDLSIAGINGDHPAGSNGSSNGKINAFTDAHIDTNADTNAEEDAPPQIGGIVLILTMLVSLGFAVAIFFLAPLFIASLLHNQIGDGWLNLLVEGVVRLILLVGYLFVIGRVPDVKRIFGYHGAEHKAINAMEQGDPLDVAHVRRASRVHTRCGTGFLLIVMVVSIFVFAVVGSPALWLKVISRIVLVPVVAGISYELMRLGAANYRFRIVKWLLAPGLALQGLTTREPDDEMIECAITSLKRVMQRDKQTVPGYEQEVAVALPPLVSA